MAVRNDHGRITGRRGVKLRQERLRQEPLCRMCFYAKPQRITLAVTPDHIKPLALGGTDTDDNVRSLCREHHDQVTREQFGQRPAKQAISIDGWPVED